MVTLQTDFGAYYESLGNLCMVLRFIVIYLLNIIQYYSVYISILDFIRKKEKLSEQEDWITLKDLYRHVHVCK